MTDTPKVDPRPKPSLEPGKDVKDVKDFKEGREVKEVKDARAKPDNIQPAPDKYRVNAYVQRLFDTMERVGVLAGFRLPGSERMVHDRRSEGEGRSGRGERSDHASEKAASDRRETRGDKRVQGSGAGDREVIERANKVLQKMEGLLAGKEGKEKPLSGFEKVLIGRFEGGEEQAQESADGEKQFAKKSAGDWSGFFEKFVSRTMQKVVGWEDVKGFLFRGLLQEKGAPQKAVLISDVQLMAGTDKFTRLSVALPKLVTLASVNPGTVISKEVVQAALAGEQLQYLALGPKLGDDAAAALFSQAVSRGMFASQQIENRVAEHLGLLSEFRGTPQAQKDALDVEARRKASVRRRGGMWARWMGGDDVGGEGSVFVPWWRWDREDRGGAKRWFVAVFGSVIIIILIALIFALFHNLR